MTSEKEKTPLSLHKLSNGIYCLLHKWATGFYHGFYEMKADWWFVVQRVLIEKVWNLAVDIEEEAG